MTSATPADTSPKHLADSDAHDSGHGLHPTEAKYIKIALILAAVTAVEVGLYYVNLGSVSGTNIALLVLAVIKFAMVAMYFMHLKFDNRVLSTLFITGLILAISVYVAALLTMGKFV